MHAEAEKSDSRYALYYVGLALVVAAVCLLAYIALYLVRLIHDPRDVALSAFILDQLRVGGQAVSGNVNGRSFYLRFDPALLAGVYTIVSLAMLTTCANVLRGLVTAGLRLMKYAGSPVRAHSADNSADASAPVS